MSGHDLNLLEVQNLPDVYGLRPKGPEDVKNPWRGTTLFVVLHGRHWNSWDSPTVVI